MDEPNLSKYYTAVRHLIKAIDDKLILDKLLEAKESADDMEFGENLKQEIRKRQQNIKESFFIIHGILGA